MEPIVGIDLGTSTTCLAVVHNGEPTVVPDNRGNRVTPSYIHVMDDGRILVGPQAKAEVISDPYSTIWATKRLIGRRFEDPHVQEAMKYFGYDIIPAPNGGVRVRGRDKEFSPSEIGAIILKYMTRIAKKALGYDVKKAVITVPAYFTDPQRKATKAAGAMIGLDVVRLVNEPTAAALAYGYDLDVEQKIAVFDLGGGTFDLSLLNIGQNVFEVIASDGDSYLGGEDFDNILVEYIIEDFKNKHGIDIFNDKMAHQRVKDAAERTKIALSSRPEVEVNLPGICPDMSRWAGVEIVITRDQYEEMTGKLAARTIKIFRELLSDQGLSVDDLDNVIMVGGMTRMPLIQRKVTELLGRSPDNSTNPDEAVAVGASIHAASLSGAKLIRKKKSASRPGVTESRAQDLTMPGTSPPPDPGLTMPGIPPAAVDPGMTMPGSPPAAVDPAQTRPGSPPPFEPPLPPVDANDLLPADRAEIVPDDDEPPIVRIEPVIHDLAPAVPASEEDATETIPAPSQSAPVPKTTQITEPAAADSDLPVDVDRLGDLDLPAPKAAPPAARPDEGREWEEEPLEMPGEEEEDVIDDDIRPGHALAAGIDDFFLGPEPEPEPDPEADEDLEDRAEEAEEEETEEAGEEPGEEPEEESEEGSEDDEPAAGPEDLDEDLEERSEEESREMDRLFDQPLVAEVLLPADRDLPVPAVMGPGDADADSDLPSEVLPDRPEVSPDLPLDRTEPLVDFRPLPPPPPPLYKSYEYEDGPEPGAEMMEEPAPLRQDFEPVADDQQVAPAESSCLADEFPVAAGPIIRDLGGPLVPGPSSEFLPVDSAVSEFPFSESPASEPESSGADLMEAPVLLDILSHTVGIAHLGGLFVPIIRRNSKLPARASQVFTTCMDNQQRLRITVLQGEHDKVKSNTPLGEFVLEGIELNKRGLPEINVTFDIDQSGIFTVSAKDRRSGAEREIRVESWAGGRVESDSEAGRPA